MLCAALPLSQMKGGGNRDLRLSGHVGFDSFPDQLVTKCVNKGFDFNILCIGKATCTRTLSHAHINACSCHIMAEPFGPTPSLYENIPFDVPHLCSLLPCGWLQDIFARCVPLLATVYNIPMAVYWSTGVIRVYASLVLSLFPSSRREPLCVPISLEI